VILNELKYDWAYPKRKQTFGIEYHPSLETHKINTNISFDIPIIIDYTEYTVVPAPVSILVLVAYLAINPVNRRRI